MAARAMWTGAVSFGLVNIPVKLFRATAAGSAKSISFHLLHQECGTRIKNVRRCPKCEVDVPWSDVVKGYEVEKGRYVELGKKELDKLLHDDDDDYAAIAIESFVALGEVDPIHFDRAYYVSPEGAGAPRAYALLYRALDAAGKVAIARVTLRTRSHLAVIRAHADHLIMSTMFFEEEIVDAGQVPGLPSGKAAHVDPKQLAMAEQLIESLSAKWDPSRYQDEYAKKARQVIDDKVSTGEVTERLPGSARGGKMVDLLDALKRSLKSPARLEPVAPSRRRARRVSRRPANAHPRRRAR